MNVIIVCHTEPGHAEGRKIIYSFDDLQVSLGVTNLIKICEEYGAKITFALCPESIKTFPLDKMAKSNYEIGLHVHPKSSHITAIRSYPYKKQFDMIKRGKEQLKTAGINPKVFVAGKWSENNDTIRVLEKLGFTHDCTPAPMFRSENCDWSRLERISMPYHPNASDYQKRGESPLLMVPVSCMYPYGIVSPELEPVCGFSWLKACFKEYYYNSIPLFHICLHSPSMTSKYYIVVMKKILEFISNYNDIEFCLASEIDDSFIGEFKGSVLPYISQINKNIIATGLKQIFL